MAKKEQVYLTGWCIDKHHDGCPHVSQHDMGAWEQTVCGCTCHPDTDEQWIRRVGPDASEVRKTRKSKATTDNPDRVKATLDRRRSNAAGPHEDKRTKRNRTRTDQKRREIQEQQA